MPPRGTMHPTPETNPFAALRKFAWPGKSSRSISSSETETDRPFSPARTITPTAFDFELSRPTSISMRSLRPSQPKDVEFPQGPRGAVVARRSKLQKRPRAQSAGVQGSTTASDSFRRQQEPRARDATSRRSRSGSTFSFLPSPSPAIWQEMSGRDSPRPISFDARSSRSLPSPRTAPPASQLSPDPRKSPHSLKRSMSTSTWRRRRPSTPRTPPNDQFGNSQFPVPPIPASALAPTLVEQRGTSPLPSHRMTASAKPRVLPPSPLIYSRPIVTGRRTPPDEYIPPESEYPGEDGPVLPMSKPTNSRQNKGKGKRRSLPVSPLLPTVIDVRNHEEDEKRARSLRSAGGPLPKKLFEDDATTEFQRRYQNNFGGERERIIRSAPSMETMAELFGNEPPQELVQLIVDYYKSVNALEDADQQASTPASGSSFPGGMPHSPPPRTPRFSIHRNRLDSNSTASSTVDETPTPAEGDFSWAPPIAELDTDLVPPMPIFARDEESTPGSLLSNSKHMMHTSTAHSSQLTRPYESMSTFKERRRRAAKLSHFFGVDYQDLSPSLTSSDPAPPLHAPLPHSHKPVVDVQVSEPGRFWSSADNRPDLKNAEMQDVIGKLRVMRAN